MPANLQRSSTGIFVDRIFAKLKAERAAAFGAKLQAVERKSLNQTLRFPLRREPRRPQLNRHPAGISGATVSPRIHQQITEPPRTAAVRQSHAQEPHFIALTCRAGRECLVECVHWFEP